jgi:hypothetical protein
MQELDHPYPSFAAVLRDIGPAEAIAQALAVSPRSARLYLAGQALPRVEVVKRNPAIDQALTQDFARQPAPERPPKRPRGRPNTQKTVI